MGAFRSDKNRTGSWTRVFPLPSGRRLVTMVVELRGNVPGNLLTRGNLVSNGREGGTAEVGERTSGPPFSFINFSLRNLNNDEKTLGIV